MSAVPAMTTNGAAVSQHSAGKFEGGFLAVFIAAFIA
jgi:hypothetical protein